MAEVKVKLDNGFECVVDDDVFDDMELVEDLAETEENPLKIRNVLNRVLGEEQKKAFAFLKEENILEGAQHVYGPWSAARCYQFLEDVVSPDCLVEFIPTAEIADKFVLAMGTYNDVTARDFEFFTPPTFCMRELDVPSYSKHVLVPARVVRNIAYHWEEIPKRWEKVN